MEKSSLQLTTMDSADMSKQSIMTFLADLKSILKLIVLILNVLPVLTGFLLAVHFTGGSLSAEFGNLMLTLIGSTLVMAGALLLNNWYEVDLDSKMLRTQKRPTVTGNFSLKAVLQMGIISSVLGIIILLFTTKEAAIYAFIGWFIYVVLYTFWSKRRYTLNTVIGSFSGAVTPLIGWAAIDSTFHIVPVVLFMVLFLWQIPHTFAIAMRRYHEYKAAGVPMLPVVYGFDITKRQTVIYTACLLPLPFFLTELGMPFVILATVLNIVWLGIGLSGFRMKDDMKWANIMFKTSLYYLMVLFFAMIYVSLTA
uniref:heme o synthase n=1 Tax=Ornithinibacillus gellani TaxID=2293253 RepID=UPI002958789E|nr:heme o synthase [Ornithinibacillus gellani]